MSPRASKTKCILDNAISSTVPRGIGPTPVPSDNKVNCNEAKQDVIRVLSRSTKAKAKKLVKADFEEKAIQHCKEWIGYENTTVEDTTKYRGGYFILVKSKKPRITFAIAIDNKLRVIEDGIQPYEYWQRKGGK